MKKISEFIIMIFLVHLKCSRGKHLITTEFFNEIKAIITTTTSFNITMEQ